MPDRRYILGGGVILCAVLGAGLRMARMGTRPMHHDEANQAVRLGMLLEGGVYRHDPAEHHGPSLYYFAAPVVRLLGARRMADLTEATVRCVPAAFGVGIILLTLLLSRDMGRTGTVTAALLAALSPAMVFYSPYFIQEMPLIFFTSLALGSLWRFLETERPAWGLLAGVGLGMMHATKETCIIAYAALAAAVIWHRLAMRGVARTEAGRAGFRTGVRFGAIVAVVVSATFFSSFFGHWRGPVDAIAAYGRYALRGTGGGVVHNHPWYYYLAMLGGVRYGRGPFWSEAFILLLAAVGLAAAVWPGEPTPRKRLGRFLALYAVATTVLYSAVPYKTPWCSLTFLHGLILLAGWGAGVVWAFRSDRTWRIGLALLLAAGMVHLGGQAIRVRSSRWCSSPHNPYVYAHTSTDIHRLAGRMEDLAAVADAGYAMPVHVVTCVENAWPLPWTLRRFPRTGYWNAPDALPATSLPDVVIAEPQHADAMNAYLGGLETVTEFYGVRPETLYLVYIRRDLYDRFLHAKGRVPL